MRTEILTMRNEEFIRSHLLPLDLGCFSPLILRVVPVLQYLAFLNGGNELENVIVE